MKAFDVIKRANNNLLQSPIRSLLTIIAVVVGAFTLTMTIAVGEGTKDIIQTQADSIAADGTLMVQDTGDLSNPFAPRKYDENRESLRGLKYYSDDDLEKVSKIKGIEYAEPFYIVSPKYVQANGSDKYSIRLLNSAKSMAPKVVSGELGNPESGNFIVLAYNYLDVLKLGTATEAIGKKVQVTYANPLGQDKTEELQVRAVLANSFVNAGASYISKEKARSMVDYQTVGTPFHNKFPTIVTKLKGNPTADELTSIRADFTAAGYKTVTVEEQISAIKGIVSAIQSVLGVFAGIAILASTFGIINTLLMSVYERTKEIGLVRALGMRKSTLFNIFALEAMSVGFWGGLLGTLLALGAGFVINYFFAKSNLLGLEGLKLLSFNPVFSLIIISSLMLVSLLSGIFPAIKASQMDPVKALRYE